MTDFKLSQETKDAHSKGYYDAEYNYVNKGYVLDFMHIPTGTTVKFKARITQFQDKYDSNWKDDDVYGRMDPISVFQGTKRTISLGWNVGSASEAESRDNLARIQLLISMLYPVYSGIENNVATISAAPLFKLSFINLIQNYGSGGSQKTSNAGTAKGKGNSQALLSGLVGKVSGFVYEPDLEKGFHGMRGAVGYPVLAKLSCEFTVFHTHPLGWTGDKKARTPLFPYGETPVAGAPLREISVAQSRSTVQQLQANINKILGGNQ